MDSSMISKIEKSMVYAQEPDRITFESFEVTFKGDHTYHKVTYNNGEWNCDCSYFQTRGICPHIMAMERLLTGSVKPAEAIPVPA